MVRVRWHRIGQIRRRGTAAAGYAQWLARTLGSGEQQSWLAGFLVRIADLIIAQKVPEQMAPPSSCPTRRAAAGSVKSACWA